MLEFFARNKVQDKVEYQVNDFIFRWKKLERLVGKEGLDGLLLVTGLDGKQSKETVKLFNWLFLGLSGKVILTSQFLNEVYSEMIVIVSKSGSNVFVTPQAHALLEGYLYAVPNLQVFCPTDPEYTNKEKLDIVKVANFYSMLKNHKKLGVLLDDGGDVKSVEKWPIIQSYALQQVGGTFFTLRFELADFTPKLQSIYKNHDKYSLEVTVEQNAKRIAGHIFGCTRIIEYTDIDKRAELSEEKLNEPLKDAVEIIEIDQNYKATGESRAKVLIGSRTNSNSNVSSQQSTIGQDPNNFHFTVEYCDPTSEVRVARTYFLGRNVEHERKLKESNVEQKDTFIVDLVYSLESVPNPNYRDEELLVNLYTNLIQGTLDSIVAVTKDYRNLNVEFIRAQVYAKLKPVITAAYGSEKPGPEDLLVELLSFNAMGESQKVDFKDIISFKLTPHFHAVRVQLLNIQSLVRPGEVLGAVLFSESFVLQEGCYLLISKEVPYFNFWNVSASETQRLQAIKKFPKFEELGPEASTRIANNRILVPTDKYSLSGINIPILKASYIFHEGGLVISQERLGWFVLLFSDIKNACMVNRMDSQWLLFQTEDCLLFSSLGRKNVALEFKGKAFELLMQRINRKENPLAVTYLNQLPSILSENPYIAKELLGRKPQQPVHQSQIVDNSLLFGYLEAKQLMILNNMKDLKLSAYRNLATKQEDVVCSADKHQLLIINGTYGSGKGRTAEYLLRYSKDYRMTGYIFNIASEMLYGKVELTAFTEMLEEFIAERSIPKGAAHLVIVVMPFWLSSREILESWSEKYHVRSVLTKINAANFYATSHYELTEHTLTYCTPGFSQSVVLDTFIEDEQQVNRMKNILWRYNQTGKVYRVVNNSIAAGVAKDLLTSNRYSSELEIFNRQKYSVYYDFGDITRFQLHFVEFRLPIRAKQGFERVAQHDGYLYNQEELDRQLEVQRTEAQTSKDDLLQILFSITETITRRNREAKSMRLRYAKGVVRLLEGGVAQITAANQFYKQKDLKEEKPGQTFGLQLVSVGYNEYEVDYFLQSITAKNDILAKLIKQRTCESATPEEKLQLERGNRDTFLDNGEFYDGHFFRDCEGNVLRQHPSIDRLVQNFIQAENDKIDEHNKQVKAQWQQYQERYLH